jgi:hypothetical protein
MNHTIRVLVVGATLALATVAGARAAELSREVKCGAGMILSDPAVQAGCLVQ